jgi:hypothetical protein
VVTHEACIHLYYCAVRAPIRVEKGQGSDQSGKKRNSGLSPNASKMLPSFGVAVFVVVSDFAFDIAFGVAVVVVVVVVHLRSSCFFLPAL